jgi:STE24 endopeptidase
MRLARLPLIIVAVIAGYAGIHAYLSRQTPTESRAEEADLHGPPAYTLPAKKLVQAEALGNVGRRLAIADTFLLPAALLVLLASGAAAWMRDVACRISRHSWVQAPVFVLLLLAALQVLQLPIQIWGHHVSLAYGLSVQEWGSWLADKAKSFTLIWAVGTMLTMLFFWIIRRSPRSWWLWFWMAAAAVTVAGVFVSPYVIDPLFNRFEPLASSDPMLVAQLERVASRGGLAIPPGRMFLMQASAKSTELNAYVTGFGTSKRVVVWDTTIAKSSPDEVAFIFAHELGHYALGHVILGTVLSCLGMLPLFWVAQRLQRALLGRYGLPWRIPSQSDWAALPVLLLVLVCLSVLSDPLANSISRSMEHDADVYGQEAVHGIVSNPRSVGRRSFQVLGEQSLDDPAPHPAFERWFGTHPPLWFRAAFSAAYDPWRAGEQPKYFAR